jgi:hypothetical protein
MEFQDFVNPAASGGFGAEGSEFEVFGNESISESGTFRVCPFI